jgi:hypothetical protein
LNAIGRALALAGSMEGHAAMDMSAAHVFVMEWAAILRDLVTGQAADDAARAAQAAAEAVADAADGIPQISPNRA